MKIAVFGAVLFAFLGTVVVTLLGLAGVLPVAQRYLDKLIYAVLVEAAVAFIALFKATDFFGPRAEATAAAKRITGRWWEMVHNHPEISTNCVTISYSESRGRIEMEAEAFRHVGGRVAKWKSTGTFLTTNDGIALGYFWKGDELDHIEDRFTGVGWLEFSVPEGRGKVMEGSGWFTTGDMEAGKVLSRCKIELIRVDDKDLSVMEGRDTDAKAALAGKQYAKWHGVPRAPTAA
jgi:hypothetical protein